MNPRFLDGPRIASTTANFALRSFDAASTCRGLAQHDFVEEFYPTQKCSRVTLFTAGAAFGSLALERMLYKHHPKLARIPQWLSAGSAATGIAYSWKHRGIE